MPYLNKLFDAIFYEGGIFPFGVLCVALYQKGKLPYFMGPFAYGVVSLGTFGLMRYITMDDTESEKSLDPLDCIQEIKTKRLLLKYKKMETMRKEEFSKYLVEMKGSWQGFIRDSARFEDKILSIKPKMVKQSNKKFGLSRKTETKLVAEGGSDFETHGHPSWRLNACEVQLVNEAKYKRNVRKYSKLQLQDTRENQQMKMLYKDMQTANVSKNKDNVMLVHLEKANVLFTGELENISSDLRNMNEDVLKLGDEKANLYNKTVLPESDMNSGASPANPTEEVLFGCRKKQRNYDQNVEKKQNTEENKSQAKEVGSMVCDRVEKTAVQHQENEELNWNTAGGSLDMNITVKPDETEEKIENVEHSHQKKKFVKTKAIKESEDEDQEKKIQGKCDENLEETCERKEEYLEKRMQEKHEVHLMETMHEAGHLEETIAEDDDLQERMPEEK